MESFGGLIISLYIFLAILVVIHEAQRLYDKKRKTPPAKREIFKNVVLPSNGNTPHTEIDEVIVTPYGIFCIEEKAHQGIIFGSEKQKYWTQCKYNGKHEPFYNPIRQNYKHTQALNELLGARLNAPIHAFVLFTSTDKVNVDAPNNKVFTSRNAMECVINSYSKQLYTPKEYREITQILRYATSVGTLVFSTHVTEVQHYLATGAR